MLSLGLPSNPPPDSDQPDKPVRLRSARYGELEEHELVRLLDSINDERARARFRESIYISLFVWIGVAWFLLYGPQVLFHTPRLVDPAALLRQQRAEQIAQLNLPANLRRAPRPAPPAKPPATKTLEHLRATAPVPPPAPTPPPPPPVTQPTPTPVTPPPPTPTPQPVPRAPQPTPVPDAPAPNLAALSRPTSAGESIRSAANAVSRGGYNLPTGPTHATHRPGLSAGPQIVSDTQGVNFDAYMQRLHDIIEHSWLPLLPESINPPISAKGITGVDFKILPNGDLGGINIITKSGETALDRAAFGAITTNGKFPPLPKEFHGPNLEIQCGFYVNEQGHE